MNSQITRNNHYVPKWYQRGFLSHGESMLHLLDLSPNAKAFPEGPSYSPTVLSKASPKRLFCEIDLYTTRFGKSLNDDIERRFFGAIDKSGAEAVRALIDNNPSRIHNHFHALFDYLDTQKLRTPKGLDWILARYVNLTQIDLMGEMQSLRDMHRTMWAESVREVVSAKASPVKFIVSDHPVTVYHRELPPNAADCSYPKDPDIALIGSQTIFALDANHCLILTNLEYAQSPTTAKVLAPRTHARSRAQSLVRTDAFIRNRELTADQVTSINYVLKSRSRKYIAAGKSEWLNPELLNTRDWRQIGEVLLPKDGIWQFGGEIFVGYKDGTTQYQDSFGRTSKAHEYLSKKPPDGEPQQNQLCPCGSGSHYENCCFNIPFRQRPSWISFSVRERNLMFCHAVRDILELDKGKTWTDIQRELTSEQVQAIHELFESIWPSDTLLREILPRPKKGILRALYMGSLDPRTLFVLATGWLDYFDEIVLAHPFIHARNVKPEFSPTKSPNKFKEQTLRNVLTILHLENYIRSGTVHLVPDPTDMDVFFRREVWDIAEQSHKTILFSAEDKRIINALTRDNMMRWQLRLPDDTLKRYFSGLMPDARSNELNKYIEGLRREQEHDPLALLQPLEPSEKGAQFYVIKGFNRETGIYLAALTGSIIYCQMDGVWDLLHEPDGDKQFTMTEYWSETVRNLAQLSFDLQVADQHCNLATTKNATTARRVLRILAQAATSGNPADMIQFKKVLDESLPGGCSDERRQEPGRISLKLKASVPKRGFQRKAITRFLLTYGLSTQESGIPLALQLQFDQPPQRANPC
jgi:hypothetical protein